jgi:hypothetical protein
LEIEDLVRAARDERAEALGEILSQDVEFISDFMAVLTITPASHPNTYRVLHIASLIGSYTALFFKFDKQRPRPSQICPALLPPIPVPGHSSFPSGHSTQAHLMAHLIKRVMDEARAAYALAGSSALPQSDIDTFVMDLTVLANRVARNREIAGLHFRTDSLAGEKLAEAARDSLIGLGTTGAFHKAIDEAKGEW